MSHAHPGMGPAHGAHVPAVPPPSIAQWQQQQAAAHPPPVVGPGMAGPGLAVPAAGPGLAVPAAGPGLAVPAAGPGLAVPAAGAPPLWEGPNAPPPGSIESRSIRAADMQGTYNAMKTLKSSVGIGSSYNALLKKVEKYVAMLQKPNATGGQLLRQLDEIDADANAWHNGHAGRPGNDAKDIARINQVENLKSGIISERRRQITQSPILGDLTLSLHYRAGGIVGHIMVFTLPVTYPQHSREYNDGTIGGVHFRYWEKITADYIFTEDAALDSNARKQAGEGGFVKEWNDIFAGTEDQGTFQSMREEMIDSRAGTLRGPRTLKFEDKPGVTLSANRTASRLLEFRVEFFTNDGQRRELYCTQRIVINNGQTIINDMTYGAVADGIAVDRGVTQPGTEPARFAINLSPAARRELPAFIEAIRTDQAEAFVNREWETAYNIGGDAMMADIYKDIYLSGKVGRGQVAGGHGIAKMHAGDETFQRDVPGGGYLVAVRHGGKITKLYYTTGDGEKVTAGSVDIDNMRNFQQIPVEWVIDPATGNVRPDFLTS